MSEAGPSRRELLALGAAALTAPFLSGCEQAISNLTQDSLALPATITPPSSKNVDPIFHLLARTTYGPRPGDVQKVKAMGIEKWLAEQLSCETIDEGPLNLRLRRFEALVTDPGITFEFKKEVIRADLARHTLLAAVYSKRQLFERMVGFWSDHFNISIDKGDCVYLKPDDDRLVIRKHALGKFRDILKASALSPAMLVYLDGAQNKKTASGAPANENYAREILELHTLGVDGGYTQDDVTAVARCLTGYELNARASREQVKFNRSLHDDGPKRILGRTITAGGGERDLDAVVEILCKHPSTAHYISTKLVRHFVCDEPPAEIVEVVARAFSETDGDIKSLLSAIFKHPAFYDYPACRIKRPLHFVASALRSVNADTYAPPELIQYLERMGQGVFQYPTPDGYPDDSRPWLGTMLWRWNFAFALTRGNVPKVTVNLDQLSRAHKRNEDVFASLVGRMPDENEKKVIGQFLSDGPAALAMVMSSPAFMRY